MKPERHRNPPAGVCAEGMRAPLDPRAAERVGRPKPLAERRLSAFT